MLSADLQSMLDPVVVDFHIHDANDRFVKDVTAFEIEEGLDAATHVLVGCPQDEGVRRNGGRQGSAMGPTAIRGQFYKFKPTPQSDARVMDLGNIVAGSLEDMHARLHAVVSALLALEKRIVVLGGGNDISFADASACADTLGEIAALNVDAHLDLRQAEQVHSGTPYRNLIDAGYIEPEDLYEIGIQPQANAPRYMAQAGQMGVHVHTLDEIQRHGVQRFLDLLGERLDGKPLFVGLDMDGVRAADAPGVSAPSPVGLRSEEVVGLVAWCRDYAPCALLEITETNPQYDIDGRTAHLAALAVYAFIFGWA